MIEVDLRPGVSSWVSAPLGCLSLGLIPLLTRSAERHFARRMDDLGVETRAGKRVGWSEFTSIKRAQGIVGSGRRVLRVNVSDDVYSPTTHATSDEYWLESPKGRVSVPFWRATNGDAVREFTLAHLPSQLLPKRQ